MNIKILKITFSYNTPRICREILGDFGVQKVPKFGNFRAKLVEIRGGKGPFWFVTTVTIPLAFFG